MIAYIKGQILENNKSNIVLLNNNMGFEIFVLENTYYKENEEVSLFIKTIVREDDISLYGFKEKQEKYLFEKLLLVNGIGPKAAMNILSYIEPNVLIEAIINKDVDTMSKIKGLGKKSAEKIIFNLKDKFDKEKAFVTTKSFDPKANELVQALAFLGYDQDIANDIADKVFDPDKNINELIKIALKELRK